jgi:mono/diheme cytochrome c family protein
MSSETKRPFTLNPSARQVALLVAVLLAIAGASIWLMQRSLATRARAATVDPSRAGHGQGLFMQSCASCHGASAQGLPRQGVDLRHSRFVNRQTDAQLLKFLRTGRTPDDKATVLGLPMPPRGGNAHLNDEDLADNVAFLRHVQKESSASAAAAPATRPAYTAISPASAVPGQ